MVNPHHTWFQHKGANSHLASIQGVNICLTCLCCKTIVVARLKKFYDFILFHLLQVFFYVYIFVLSTSTSSYIIPCFLIKPLHRPHESESNSVKWDDENKVLLFTVSINGTLAELFRFGHIEQPGSCSYTHQAMETHFS